MTTFEDLCCYIKHPRVLIVLVCQMTSEHQGGVLALAVLS